MRRISKRQLAKLRTKASIWLAMDFLSPIWRSVYKKLIDAIIELESLMAAEDKRLFDEKMKSRGLRKKN